MTDVDARPQQATSQDTGEYAYQRGFGNEFASEAVIGALPQGRNSPQRPPLGLFAEQISGTAFTQPRAVNRRTWVYRIMPSAAHPKFSRVGNGTLRGTPFDELEPDPNRLRWDALPMPGGDAGRARGGAARHQVPGGAAGRPGPRLPMRELRRRVHAARTRPDRGGRAGQ